MPDKKLKCVIDDTFISFCDSLEDKLSERANANVKGLTQVDIMYKPHEIRTIGVAYKKHSKDKGTMLNYCPFCGKGILNLEGIE